ncbi:MAG: peptidylprolyl isomerase [Candidatus Micrarchaeota archaeon]|nr:peptidylprolyl isomerase [Candidatus Micrarchaeota archaeon]
MVEVQAGDILILDLTGRTALDGTIFETTIEEIAKEAGIWSKDTTYKPKVVIAKNGMMLQGLEEEIEKMNIGEEKEIKVSYEKGFGPRDQNLIRVISIKEFKKANVQPSEGMVVFLDGIMAIVKSVSSGRVVLDFNHPLAGKDLIYTIKLLDVVREPEKKCEILAQEFDAQIEIIKTNDSKPQLIIKKIDEKKLNGFLAVLKLAIGDWAKIVNQT